MAKDNWGTIVLIVFLTQFSISEQHKCEKALRGKQCHQIYSMLQQPSNKSPQICRFQRMRFMNRCSSLIIDEDHEPKCTPKCRKVLTQLNKRLRDNFLFCNCRGDIDCLLFQQRAYRCMNQTLKYKKNCDLERQKCEKDSECFQLYGKWFEECQKMFNGYKCPVKCELAEEKLFSNPIGQSLKTCECAGSKTQETFCRSVRMQKEKLCGKIKEKVQRTIEDPEDTIFEDDCVVSNNTVVCTNVIATPVIGKQRKSSATTFNKVKAFEIIILTNLVVVLLRRAFFVIL